MIDPFDYIPTTPNPEVVRFQYLLDHHGWATLGVEIGDQAFEFKDFGNTTDGLGDLVRAALQIATGDSYAGVIFDGEPHRYGLAVEPAGLSSDNRRIVRISARDGGTSLK